MKCDINKCKREATWHHDGLHFCSTHMPLEPLPGDQARKKQGPRSPLALPEIDSDVEFLMALAKRLDDPKVADIHTRLVAIAGRIQEALDLQALRLSALRQDRKGVPPVTRGLQSDVASPEHIPDANYVGRLQEMGQKTGWPDPEYSYERQGEDHEPIWNCTISYGPKDNRQGHRVTMLTKGDAKQAAAERALMSLLASTRRRIKTTGPIN